MGNDKCVCHCIETWIAGVEKDGTPIWRSDERCFGTKEKDPCSCGGDKSKCNYYAEKE